MASQSPVETESITGQSPREILKTIGEEFNLLLKKNTRAQAYKHLQQELMKNMDKLVPAVIPLKDHISTVTGLEEFLNGSLSATSKPPIDALADWLNGKEMQ